MHLNNGYTFADLTDRISAQQMQDIQDEVRRITDLDGCPFKIDTKPVITELCEKLFRLIVVNGFRGSYSSKVFFTDDFKPIDPKSEDGKRLLDKFLDFSNSMDPDEETYCRPEAERNLFSNGEIQVSYCCIGGEINMAIGVFGAVFISSEVSSPNHWYLA